MRKEADFLIHRGGRFELSDAKWTERPSSDDAAKLSRVAAELPVRTERVEAIPFGEL